jgi:hypothetical protein
MMAEVADASVSLVDVEGHKSLLDGAQPASAHRK